MGLIDPAYPLINLHQHLDGAVRLETILELGRQHNLPLPAWDLEGLRPFVQVSSPQPGLLEFLAKFQWMNGILADLEACRRVAYENIEDASRQDVDYIELRFSPAFMSEPFHLPVSGVVEAVADGTLAGQRDFGVKVNLIGILSRHYGPDQAWNELQALLDHREAICALDLAGDEAHFPGALFVEHFKKGREAGWHITVHAGEADGPNSIWQALQGLGAERIGHGSSAVQDPHLMQYLAEHKVGVEVNLTSNVQTSVAPDYAGLPLRRFLEAGILANINTDDPTISGIDLPYEYETAAPAAGLSAEQIHRAQRNALEMAFLSPAEKADLVAKKANHAH
jgi:adenosine deaminase